MLSLLQKMRRDSLADFASLVAVGQKLQIVLFKAGGKHILNFY